MSEIIKGKGVSQGIAIGKVFIYVPYSPVIETQKRSNSSEVEKGKYQEFKSLAKNELNIVISSFFDKSRDKSDIFRAHLEILNDEELDLLVEEGIESSGLDARSSIIVAFDKFNEMLSMVDDPLIRAKLTDFLDVRNRLLRISDNQKEINLSLIDSDAIICCYDLLPSDTATLNKTHVLGLISEIGGETSHSAILARSYEIPLVLGVKGIVEKLKGKDVIILNAVKGEIIINPSESELNKAANQQHLFLEKARDNKLYFNKPSVTKDGVKIDVCLNIGNSSPDSLRDFNEVDGIGLFRSEFIFMDHITMPTMQEQFDIYKTVLERYQDKPVIIRTLDIGGDKTLTYLKMDKEDNPFLGLRAIRLCFEHLDIFETQIKAMLKASAYGNLWIMVPMVSSIDEIVKFKGIIKKYESELIAEGIKVGSYKLGVMIEIPSLCLIADKVAEIVDFASFGTNDLCQYTLAVDRMNPKVESYYQNMHPAIFKLMKIAIDAFNKQHKVISVCGELGGNPLAASVLIGLGMKKLSMNRNSVGIIKKLISHNEISDFKKIANKAIKFGTEKEIVSFLNKKLKNII